MRLRVSNLAGTEKLWQTGSFGSLKSGREVDGAAFGRVIWELILPYLATSIVILHRFLTGISKSVDFIKAIVNRKSEGFLFYFLLFSFITFLIVGLGDMKRVEILVEMAFRVSFLMILTSLRFIRFRLYD